MGFGNWLKCQFKHSVTIWVVKQIDDSLLHLCGEATVEFKGAPSRVIDQLRANDYRGAIRMQETGALLNATQFDALVPLADLQLHDRHEAQWRDRHWRIAWTPQRCWLHDGRLIAQPSRVSGHSSLVSCEDVSNIRAKAEAPHFRHARSRPYDFYDNR